MPLTTNESGSTVRRRGDRPFLSVQATARLLGMSEMTLYRAIAAGEFPAVRVRGRLIVPARAIDEMVDAALAETRMVDASDWVPEETRATAVRYADDRGSVPVLPMLGFAAFLAVGWVFAQLPFAAFLAFGLAVTGAGIAMVAQTVRVDRRANDAYSAAFAARRDELLAESRVSAVSDEGR